jgi:hypothetical protein
MHDWEKESFWFDHFRKKLGSKSNREERAVLRLSLFNSCWTGSVEPTRSWTGPSALIQFLIHWPCPLNLLLSPTVFVFCLFLVISVTVWTPQYAYRTPMFASKFIIKISKNMQIIFLIFFDESWCIYTLSVGQKNEEIICSFVNSILFYFLKNLVKNFQKFVNSLAIIFDTWNLFRMIFWHVKKLIKIYAEFSCDFVSLFANFLWDFCMILILIIGTCYWFAICEFGMSLYLYLMCSYWMLMCCG